MNQVKVKRAAILERIRANRTKHIEEYNEACRDYKEDALAAIDEATANLRGKFEALEEGEMIALAAISFPLPFPESHEDDYDQAIDMLEMSVDEELTVSSREFASFVRDDWAWKTQFDATRNSYSNKAMAVGRAK